VFWEREFEVNRPFYAIGVLLAALGAAMVLVQTTSQRPVAQPKAGSGTNLTLPAGKTLLDQPAVALGFRQVARGGVFVFVLPENEPILESSAWQDGCGLDRTTGEIYPLVSRDLGRNLAGSVTTPRVHTVEEFLAAEEPENADGLTQYDLDYDTAVYGLATAMRVRQLRQVDPEAELLEDLDPALQLLRDLLKNRPQLPQRPKIRRSRLASSAPAIPDQPQAPTWQDYEDWIASRQDVAEGDGPIGGATGNSPQAGRRVAQFAADALHRVAELLQAAASELERVAAPEIATVPGKGESSSSQK
jgi:hypothetical protein